jgi:hypothetical protein
MEYHWVRPKRYLSLWYVWHKPCTYLAPTLTLSPNRLKWDSTWPKSPRSYIGAVQTDFWAYGTFDMNRAPILRQDKHYFQMEWNEHPLEPRHLGVPSSASKIISEPMVHLAQNMQLSCTDTNMAYVTKEFNRVRQKRFLRQWYVRRKPCNCLVSRLAPSPNRLNWASTWASSPRITIRCIQNDFWAYGMFGANCETILRQD